MKIAGKLFEYPQAAVYQIKNKPIATSSAAVAVIGGGILTSFGFGIAVASCIFANPIGIALAIAGTTVCLSGWSSCVIGSCIYGILFDQAIFGSYQKKHSRYIHNGKPVLLVLTAAYDHNGVFNHNQRTMFARIEKNYNIVFKKVSNAKQVMKEVRLIGQNEKIAALWINAHGDPAGLTLGKKDNLLVLTKEIDRFNRIIKKNLTKKALIILNACSTAGDLKIPSPNHHTLLPLLNFAETVALATKRKVYAAKEDFPTAGLKLRSAKTLSVEFSNFSKCLPMAVLQVLHIKRRKNITISITAKAAKKKLGRKGEL